MNSINAATLLSILSASTTLQEVDGGESLNNAITQLTQKVSNNEESARDILLNEQQVVDSSSSYVVVAFNPTNTIADHISYHIVVFNKHEDGEPDISKYYSAGDFATSV